MVSVMEPATTRFFDMPELVDHLTKYLDYPGIYKLMLTSRRMHDLCMPAQYRRVQPGRFFYDRTTDSMQSFAKNVHRVRELTIWRHGIVYYTSCVTAFLDLLATQQSIASTVSRQPSLSRPVWLSPRDPHLCKVVPIPPMTLLTKLSFFFGEQGEFEGCPYYLPSYRDPKATITQLCWLIESNPHLLDVKLHGFIIKDDRDAGLLTRTISGLQKLQNLSVFFFQWDEWAGPWTSRIGVDLFFACPPTLRNWTVRTDDLYEEDIDVFTDEFVQLPPGDLQSWEKSDEECGLKMTTPRRQEPMLDLKTLSLGALAGETMEEDIRSVFRRCPNLMTLEISPIPSAIIDIQRLAQDIARYCPKLCDLSFHAFGEGAEVTGELLLLILKALPPQQVTRFNCNHLPLFTSEGLGSGAEVGYIFRQHSSTLRTLSLSGCRNIDSKAIQTILIDCEALEDLLIAWKTGSDQRQLCLHLEDAIEFSWGCTRLQRLDLWIAIPDEPLHHLADGVVPYYNRPAPTRLSRAETAQFRSLGSFYRQIGALTELRSLDLKALFYDPAEKGRGISVQDTTFPGLFGLWNNEAGRPGYLQLLGGLTKLESLSGSISATTEEARATIGMNEVIWMEQHWPSLERGQFFRDDDDERLPVPFPWWKRKRAEGRLQLFPYE
ncbi:hypothetical protein KI688_011808 [Linnemannia hyalina]|uniref:F-box domain-containing protein n=1 Tax=Linnemannia hyalina TaxID=64524 RepID=A0A9P8BUG6_9FUNG|nr:hypothetical protein KI688_011808 [Linnemannia hyalina]